MTAVIEASSAGVKDMADGALFARLEKRVAVDEAGCWKFIGCITPRGYGAVQLRGSKVGAHRAMWQAVNGQIPSGMLICHRCDVPDCINPDHLFLGTSLDNNRDRAQKGRSHRPKGELNVMAKLSDQQVMEAMQRYSRCETAAQIAASMNVSPATISSWVRKLRMQKGKAGVNNGRAKLNPEKISEVKRLLAAGMSQMAVSRQFGVSGHAIWRIANGRSWQ